MLLLNGQNTGDDAVGFFCAEINRQRIKNKKFVYYRSVISVTDTDFFNKTALRNV